MTNAADSTPFTATRQLTCARCGAAFGCNLAGGCWCDAEPYRLPLPTQAAQDCLCPTCLRQMAQEQAQAGAAET
ncbi:MAG: hypothetical protein GC182_06150 [Rhodopseudomonas sp.]|nr:hypothetical protein [Rhodopseudomonas sp.]